MALSGAATDVVYSPDQKLCAVADSNRKVTLFTVGQEKYEKTHTKVLLSPFSSGLPFCYNIMLLFIFLGMGLPHSQGKLLGLLSQWPVRGLRWS